MKSFVRQMLKIATFTTILTFVGLLLFNAGWISPRPIPTTLKHIDTYHTYDTEEHLDSSHEDTHAYSFE